MPTLDGSPRVSVALPDDAESLPSLPDGECDADVLLDALDDVLGVCQPDESVPKPAKGPSPRPKSQRTRPKKRNYDPNKARSEQLRELRRLRVEVRDLELKVQQLQSPNGSRDPFPTPSQEKEQALPKVWEAICTRQLARRLKAEQENCRLKKRQRAEMKVVRRVEKVLFKRVMGMETERSKRIRRVEIPAGFIKQLADRIFDELSKGVELSYREVESVLETNCPVPLDVETHQPLRKEGVSIELFDSRVMPFDVQVTGDAWWRRWQNYRGLHSHEDSDHVIRERCGLEMVDVMTDKAATFYVQQILHRQVEEHRVAIVWNSYFEPFSFGEAQCTVSPSYSRAMC